MADFIYKSLLVEQQIKTMKKNKIILGAILLELTGYIIGYFVVLLPLILVAPIIIYLAYQLMQLTLELFKCLKVCYSLKGFKDVFTFERFGECVKRSHERLRTVMSEGLSGFPDNKGTLMFIMVIGSIFCWEYWHVFPIELVRECIFKKYVLYFFPPEPPAVVPVLDPKTVEDAEAENYIFYLELTLACTVILGMGIIYILACPFCK